ncbi:hypothetical protein [Okeania sp.]|uniref:hypothetical protein n=1 Tax=Okeania sp. TaxID=3100323 RepID=UPI002B4B8911|nr:hypothetical protein [Okeania sp.]MEB3341692.1 hypothetical protein [Okeania sp.]
MKKLLFIQNKLITTLVISIILVGWVGFNNKIQAKTEEKRAACVLIDFDGRVRSSGPCNVILTTTNSAVEFDIEWDGTYRTQFSMRKFPTDGTYNVKIKDGGRASLIVEKEGSVFIFNSRDFRGRVIFP